MFFLIKYGLKDIIDALGLEEIDMRLLEKSFVLDKICNANPFLNNHDLRQDESLFNKGIVRGYSTLIESVVHIYVEHDSNGIYVITENRRELDERVSNLEALADHQIEAGLSDYWSKSCFGFEYGAYIEVMLSLGFLTSLTEQQKKYFIITPELGFILENRAIKNVRLFTQLPKSIQEKIESQFEPREALYGCLSDPLDEWLSSLDEMMDFASNHVLPLF